MAHPVKALVIPSPGILQEVYQFYSSLFQSEGVDSQAMDNILGFVHAPLSDQDREFCDEDITLVEIEQAIEGMSSQKSWL